jgi:hypothetical protein
METYFTFPDGGLRYHCPSCRQHCCRGKGFGLGTSELIPLLSKLPSLAPHLKMKSSTSFHAADLTEGCWYLRPDGNCGVEINLGRALKPSTCRLFPFNRIYRVGPVRVVDFNSTLCPLEPADGAGVTWAELEREMAELADNPALEVPAWQPALLDDDWLAIERRTAALHREHADDPDGAARAEGDERTAARAREWGALYGLDADEQARLEWSVAPMVALLVPSLRWNYLFRKDALAYPIAVDRLTRRLRAVTFLAALAARTAGAPPSLRGLTELCHMQSFTLDVLERWDEPVRLVGASFDADVPAPLEPALGALLAGAFRGGKPLGELLQAAAGTLPAPLRSLVVALASTQLETLFPPRV